MIDESKHECFIIYLQQAKKLKIVDYQAYITYYLFKWIMVKGGDFCGFKHSKCES